MVEVTHVSLLIYITEKRERITTDRTWATPAAGEVLRAARMKTAPTCIDHRQGMVVQWVALRPIF